MTKCITCGILRWQIRQVNSIRASSGEGEEALTSRFRVQSLGHRPTQPRHCNRARPFQSTEVAERSWRVPRRGCLCVKRKGNGPCMCQLRDLIVCSVPLHGLACTTIHSHDPFQPLERLEVLLSTLHAILQDHFRPPHFDARFFTFTAMLHQVAKGSALLRQDRGVVVQGSG